MSLEYAKKMNNQNENDFDLAVVSAAVAEEVSSDTMQMCWDMPVYPEGQGLDGFSPIINAEAPVKIDNDMTLFKYNSMEEDTEELSFLNLDQLTKTTPTCEEMIFDGQEKMDFADESQDYFYCGQQPIEVNVNFDNYRYDAFSPMSEQCVQSELLSPVESSYPPSPTSTINSFLSEPINNNNNDTRILRTRKVSFKAEKSAKIGLDKMSRTRRTKADMERMTDKEKKEVKQNQNRVNAKKSVARKNEEKANLGELLPKLEEEYKHLAEKNTVQENGLLNAYATIVYPIYDNNAPYGLPDQLRESIEHSKKAASQQFMDNNGHVLDLQKKKKDAQEKLDKVLNQDLTNINPATFASQKSRANSAYEIARLKYETANFQQIIMTEKQTWNVLADVALTINPYLKKEHRKEFPEYFVNIDEVQFEPS